MSLSKFSYWGSAKSAFIIEIPRSCNSPFSKRTKFNSFIQVFIEIVSLVQGLSMEKPLVSTVVLDSWKTGSARNLSLVRFSITLFLCNYLLNFFHQGPKWILWTNDKTIPRKTVGFGRFIRIFIVRKIWNIPMKFDSSSHLNWRFSVTKGLISSIEISIETFTLVEEDSVEKF